jgi:hypothetical protein
VVRGGRSQSNVKREVVEKAVGKHLKFSKEAIKHVIISKIMPKRK